MNKKTARKNEGDKKIKKKKSSYIKTKTEIDKQIIKENSKINFEELYNYHNNDNKLKYFSTGVISVNLILLALYINTILS